MRQVLVVDDDDAIREVIEIALRIVGGMGVISAASGAHCLKLAREDTPDAILLDVMMPSMDGVATLERLRRDPTTRDIPVILVTAKVRANDRRRWERLSHLGVITKPFDPMTLASEVTSMLGWE